jgi:sulfatase maturation enzyme AslB (radical SAM superfamily)
MDSLLSLWQEVIAEDKKDSTCEECCIGFACWGVTPADCEYFVPPSEREEFTETTEEFLERTKKEEGTWTD